MWVVMLLMTFVYTPASNKEIHQCDKHANTTIIWSQFNNCLNVALSNKNIHIIQTSNESHYKNLIKLDISYNKLEKLPLDFLSNAIALQEVDLKYNALKHLPEMFLISSTKLEILTLEGNPLSEIPASVFHDTLVRLTVNCQCVLASKILMHLNNNSANYSRLNAMCQNSAGLTSLKDFHKENCGNQYLALYIVLPILVIILIVGGVALYMWKWKRSSSLESKGATDMSPAHVQSRYTSRNMEGTATTLSPGQRQDYENVFVGHLRTSETKPYGYLENEHEPRSHSKNTGEDDIYLESDINEGEQPIYSNTQGIYYNYSTTTSFPKSKNKEDDDVYILPDQ